MRPGQVRGPHRARLRGGVEIRDLSGFLPCEAFSRLSHATRRSHGSLPQHVSHCPYELAEEAASAGVEGPN